MAKVGIVMGSDSDMPVMAKAADILEQLGISYEMTIISAHREPDVFFEYAKTAEEKGFKVIIAGAGMAAHLPGMCAAIFPMPVIGIPMHTTSLGGRDSLYSIVQMPSGIPVATVKKMRTFRKSVIRIIQNNYRLNATEKLSCKAAEWRKKWITKKQVWILKPVTNQLN